MYIPYLAEDSHERKQHYFFRKIKFKLEHLFVKHKAPSHMPDP